MKRKLRSQVSVFEIAFGLTLFFSFILYFGFYSVEKEIGIHKTQVDTFIDSIYYSEEFRTIFTSEDLSSSSITQNWTNFSTYANDSFLTYSLVLSNETTNKIIYSCNESSGKEITEKIIAIKDNDYYEFRKITFGVCY